MPKFQVANIKFSFEYNFNDYYQNHSEAYLIDDQTEVDHHLTVSLKDIIEMPTEKSYGNKNPYTILKDNERTIYSLSKDKQQVRLLIRHDLAYQQIQIELNRHLIQDLPMTEYIFSGMMFLELAMHLGYLPVHAAALKIHDEVVLFSAPSGTGKSTHSRYWREVHPDVVSINDDKPILLVKKDETICYGSFFSGEDRINQNTTGKVKAIVLLSQGLDNKIEMVDPKTGLEEIIRNTLTPKLESTWDQTLKAIVTLVNTIPIYKLHATNNHDSVHTIYQYLFLEGKRHEN